MFTVRLALRSNGTGLRTCTMCSSRRHGYENKKQFTSDARERLIVKVTSSRFENYEKSHRTQLQHVRRYATDEAPNENADVFGSLSNEQYHKFEMDEDEKEEEKFVENEARVHRRYRLTEGGYANLIKSHIQKGDLKAALEVLDLVKKNRDEATPYMYNLLLRAYAVIGDFKQSRSLYVTMKKRGLKCNSATYTSIINACATYHHSETALDYLSDLRQEFAEKNIPLNDTHYNALIKAYGRHKNVLEAFKLADEMRDKRLATTEVTFNSLLIAAISDKDAGLRHALMVWHQMRRHRITPTINTYNLLLRAIRDTKLGDLKINDILVAGSEESRILLNEDAPPNLLGRWPSLNSLVLTRTPKHANEIIEDESEVITSSPAAPSSNLPATTDSTDSVKSLTPKQETLINIPLEKIHYRNRLILFGGVTGILDKMKEDGVVPDSKTLTFLMELVPPSSAAEDLLVRLAHFKKIPLDLCFYNMLMKKRSIRRDYDGAKKVLSDIQRNGLCPDIITWGIIAMGCETSEEARTMIEGMRATGHRLNVVIAGTLINVACRKIRFGYILEMMETMKRYNIKPNWTLYAALDAFKKEMEMMIKSKKFTRTVNKPAFKIGFSKFNCRYVTWKEEMGHKSQNKESTDKKAYKAEKR